MDTVAGPDEGVRGETLAHLASRAPSPGAWGRLAELAGWLSACQGRTPPRPLRRTRVVLFAADHGIAAAGVSADPPAATLDRVRAVCSGDAAVCRFAEIAGAGVRVVDVGLGSIARGSIALGSTALGPVGYSPCSGADARSVRRGSGRIDVEDALTSGEVSAAVRAGADVADEEIDAGADLLVPGEVGVGVSTPTAVLAAAMTSREPVEVVGRGSGIDDRAWMIKTAAVRDALRRTRAAGRQPERLLGVAGGADLAALCGFLRQASQRRTPVLLDGAAVVVAGLLADRWSLGAAAWWVAGSRCTEPSQALALEALGLDPLLGLSMRAGQGTGALAALPLLQLAVATAT